MPELTYREKLDQKRLEAIRQMLLLLPRSCADFIRSLMSTTSMLTRLAYTIDLGTFFDFAMKELSIFSSQNATEVTDAQIALLKPRDIELYAEYLSLYYKQNGQDESEQRLLRNQTLGVMRKLSSLRSYFNYLFRTQRIPANIASLVPLPKKHEKPILLLERGEMEKLLAAIATGTHLTPQQAAFHRLTQSRDFAIVMLFLGTGIRVSECVGIDLEDVDFRVNALLVTRKGGNQVILYFPKEVADALKAYLAQRETITPVAGHEHALFLSLQRKRITQRAVELMVKKYAMLVVPLKRRMSPHKLRSTYATNLYQATEDIYLVAEALGHSDVNTTRKHYASMSDARMREAASNTHLHYHMPVRPEQEMPNSTGSSGLSASSASERAPNAESSSKRRRPLPSPVLPSQTPAPDNIATDMPESLEDSSSSVPPSPPTNEPLSPAFQQTDVNAAQSPIPTRAQSYPRKRRAERWNPPS
jgi:integrase/recombinase XerC